MSSVDLFVRLAGPAMADSLSNAYLSPLKYDRHFKISLGSLTIGPKFCSRAGGVY